MTSRENAPVRRTVSDHGDRGLASDVAGYEHVELRAGAAYRTFMHGSVTIPLHWHPEIEIVTVLAGEVGFSVAGQSCLMRAGDMMIVNANVVHNSVAWSPDALVCGMHIHGEHYEAAGLPGFASRHFLCRSFLHGKYFRTTVDPIRAIVARLVIHAEEAAGEAFLHRWLAEALCYFIYQKVPWDRKRLSLDRRNSSGRDRILHVMRRIRDEFAHDVSLQRLAEESGVTVSHLSRNFKAYVGLGFQEYVINLRLDRALRQVRGTSAPISEIAGCNGFTNSTLFFAKFRERFGCTPAEFRNGKVRGVGPEHAAPVRDADAARLLLETAARLDDLGALGAVAAPRGPFRLSAPHNLAAVGGAAQQTRGRATENCNS
ncbi:AraC family transcriptional regulator [Antarcticirhabdus aurantiaca]|uniref:AraC family transcriptional regulator n=1 Tax=Antarcticirhabdus aurantiaca TaxID=2606717 RepID=A0ACD4NNT8_9HYPH|nr:AraC family transcriptional regulator [Jeongeuplla avenae]